MSFAAGAGIANIDLIYRGLPKIPQEGEEIYAEAFAIKLGGGVVNTLANLAFLGIPVKIATYLGTDIFSEFARRQLYALGIEPENLYTGGGIPLSVSTAAITAGERTFISYVERRPPDEDEREKVYRLLSGAKIVEMQIGFLETYRRLKKEGSLLVLDMGWDEELSFEKYHEYLELADYFTPNRREALKISGASSPEAAAERLSRYFDKTLIKLDREGALIYENGKAARVPPVEEFGYVDAAGAGDAFLSGFMYGLYHGRAFKEAVLLGNILGAKCAGVSGCLGPEMTEAELLALFSKYRNR
jgi:sugar/nucleoside kinase (ribokinase family)